MNALNDDALIEIFKKLDLNERVKLRLASKRFKQLVDSIKIKKLAIFRKTPQADGRFFLSNQKWSLEETAYVNDVEKFFRNKIILNSLKQVVSLFLSGPANEDLCKVNVKFNELKHLEVHNFDFEGCAILKSSKIETFFCNGLFYNDTVLYQALAHNSTSVQFTGFNGLKSKLKKFETRYFADLELFKHSKDKKLFDQIECLNVFCRDFKVIKFANDNFPTLKVLNCASMGNNLQEFDSICSQQADLKQFVQKLRSDFAIYVWGLPFKASTLHLLLDFLSKMANYIMVNSSRVNFIATNESMKILKEFKSKNANLFTSEFYEIFATLIVEEPISNLKQFNCEISKMWKIETAFLSFKREMPTDFERYLKFLPNLVELRLNFAYLSADNEKNLMLNQLPVLCKKLHTLTLEVWSEINFDFLFKLRNLKFIKLLTPFPIRQEQYIHLIRQLKHLALFEVYCERTDKMSKDQLSAFKKLVLSCLNDEIMMKDAIFKIEIHKNNKNVLVRYFMMKKTYSYNNTEDADNDDLIQMHKMTKNM